MKLSIDTRALSQRETLLSLTGELDYASAQQLRAAITTALDSAVESIVISLAGVTFVDSTGIGTLVVARRICNDMRVTLRVSEANPFISRLFAVVGVAEVLGLVAPVGTPTAAPYTTAGTTTLTATVPGPRFQPLRPAAATGQPA